MLSGQAFTSSQTGPQTPRQEAWDTNGHVVGNSSTSWGHMYSGAIGGGAAKGHAWEQAMLLSCSVVSCGVLCDDMTAKATDDDGPSWTVSGGVPWPVDSSAWP